MRVLPIPGEFMLCGVFHNTDGFVIGMLVKFLYFRHNNLAT